LLNDSKEIETSTFLFAAGVAAERAGDRGGDGQHLAFSPHCRAERGRSGRRGFSAGVGGVSVPLERAADRGRVCAGAERPDGGDRDVRTCGRTLDGLAGCVRGAGLDGHHVLLCGRDGLVSLLRGGPAVASAAELYGSGAAVLGRISGESLAGGVSGAGTRTGRGGNLDGRAGHRAGQSVSDPVAAGDSAGCAGAGADAEGGLRGRALSVYAAVERSGAAAAVAGGAHAERLGHGRGLGIDSDLCGLHAARARRGAERFPDGRGQQYGVAAGGADDLRDGVCGAGGGAVAGRGAGGDAHERAGFDGADLHLVAAAFCPNADGPGAGRAVFRGVDVCGFQFADCDGGAGHTRVDGSGRSAVARAGGGGRGGVAAGVALGTEPDGVRQSGFRLGRGVDAFGRVCGAGGDALRAGAFAGGDDRGECVGLAAGTGVGCADAVGGAVGGGGAAGLVAVSGGGGVCAGAVVRSVCALLGNDVPGSVGCGAGGLLSVQRLANKEVRPEGLYKRGGL